MINFTSLIAFGINAVLQEGERYRLLYVCLSETVRSVLFGFKISVLLGNGWQRRG